MKKVYFACSVRGGRGDKDLTPLGTPGATSKTYARDMAMLEQAELVIAEVTTPSLGVGYEIARAEARGIPVLALYRPQPGKGLSAMIDGSPRTQVVNYQTIDEAEAAIKSFIG